MISKYILMAIVSLIAKILNYFIAPLVVMFASDDGWLPKWLWWFQTPDNSLDGDKGWKTQNRPFLNESSIWKQDVNRIAWLYRNSMYGFNISVLGMKVGLLDWIETEGNPKISNRPLVEGLVVRKLYREGRQIAFQWYYVKAWSSSYCVRLNFGWKLWGKQPSGQLVFTPSFTMGYSK